MTDTAPVDLEPSQQFPAGLATDTALRVLHDRLTAVENHIGPALTDEPDDEQATTYADPAPVARPLDPYDTATAQERAAFAEWYASTAPQERDQRRGLRGDLDRGDGGTPWPGGPDRGDRPTAPTALASPGPAGVPAGSPAGPAATGAGPLSTEAAPSGTSVDGDDSTTAPGVDLGRGANPDRDGPVPGDPPTGKSATKRRP